jgi:hypothetical protein
MLPSGAVGQVAGLFGSRTWRCPLLENADVGNHARHPGRLFGDKEDPWVPTTRESS